MNKERKTVIYSRVPSQGQKSDLATQEQLLEHYAIKNGYSNIVKLKDIASGLVDDLMAIVTSFSSKIYGLRSYKAKHIVKTLKTEGEA